MSEAPDVEKQSLHWDKDGQNRLHENINLSLRHQIPFHPKKKSTQEWRWSALDLAKFIPPHPWLRYCHSNSAICIWDPFFSVITTYKKRRPERFSLASLKDPSRSDAASAPVHRHRASLIQSFLRRLHQDGQAAVGHLALLHGAHQLHRKQSGVSDNEPRSQDGENTHNSRFQSVRAPSHPRTLRGRTWNRHRLCSWCVKAERGRFINNSVCVCVLSCCV